MCISKLCKHQYNMIFLVFHTLFWFITLILSISFSEVNVGSEVPFDLYCPTKMNEITKRTCPVCKIYHPSHAAMDHHKQIHRIQQSKEEQLHEDEISSTTVASTSAPVYESLQQYFQNFNQFEDCWILFYNFIYFHICDF